MVRERSRVMFDRNARWAGRAVMVLFLTLVGLSGMARGFQGPGGPEVLSRGPIHEAFASPVVFNATPGLIVPKQPPNPIEEQPPDQRPEGAAVEWVPGYWAWDDERDDFLWISGIWRDIPPGRQWVPGYWHQVDAGYRWTSGFWAPTASDGRVNYLPEPPPTLEVGPNSPQPGPEFFWTPGSWPGTRTGSSGGPATGSEPSPNGSGSRRPTSRPPAVTSRSKDTGIIRSPVEGLPFAPVYFGPTFVPAPTYVYSPNIVLSVGGLTASLFLRPEHVALLFRRLLRSRLRQPPL